MSERNTVTDVLLIILSIFLPFVAVGIRRGFCTADFLINFALCFLGYIPGLIHAWYIIAKYPRARPSTENEPLLYA